MKHNVGHALMILRRLNEPLNGMRLIGTDARMNCQQIRSNVVDVYVRIAVADIGLAHDLLQ